MKRILTLLLFIGFYVTSYAHAPNPVSWTFCIKKGVNNEAEIIITAKIDKGYHLWSTNPGHADLIPTAIVFKKAAFFETIGNIKEEGKMIKEDMTKIDLGIVNYYDHTVKFIQKVKLKKTGTIECSIEYQTCSHEGCLPPRVDEFSIETENICKAGVTPKYQPVNFFKSWYCAGWECEINVDATNKRIHGLSNTAIMNGDRTKTIELKSEEPEIA